MGKKVFLSYSQSDREQAQELAYALTRNGISIVAADSELGPGSRWRGHVEEALHDADAIVVVVGKSDTDSDILRAVWSMAQETVWEHPEKRFVPVLLKNVPAPAFLQKWSAVPVDGTPDDWERVAQEVAKIVSLTDSAVAQTEGSPNSALRERWRDLDDALRVLGSVSGGR